MRGARKWLGRSAALVLVVGGLIVAFGNLGDRLILWPTTQALDAHGARRLTVPFAGGELEVFRAANSDKPPESFVLRFYGNADRAEHWVTDEAHSIRGRAVELWGVNYPGYGGSTGPARLHRIADAALAAYDALRAVAGARPIHVFGTSLGTTAALRVAAEREVAGLVLRNPPALRELVVGDHGWWNLWLLAWPISRQIPLALDSIANARRVRAPAVFILAEDDEVVRPRYQRLVVDAFSGAKAIFLQPGGRHNTPLPPALAAEVESAIERLLAGQFSPTSPNQ